MSRKRIILFSAVMLTIIAIIIALFLLSTGQDTPAVSLPPVTTQNAGVSGSATADEIIVTIDKSTAPAVLEVLRQRRQELEYYRVITVTRYWSGGSGESVTETWTDGESMRITVTEGRTVKNILISGSEFYIWYGGGDSLFTGKSSDADADMLQGLISYDGVEADDIISAEYIPDYNGQACILISFAHDQPDYEISMYISAITGLVMQAQAMEDGKLATAMQSSEPELDPELEGVFELPENLRD